MRRQLLLAAPLVALGLALSGCAGQGGDTPAVATANNGAAPAASESAAPSDEERARQFAACMREEGIDVPDPEPGAGGAAGGNQRDFAFRIEGSDKGKLNAAMEKCRQYLPNGGEMRPLTPEQLERQRELAKCMRANGVPDFPDPDPNGGGAIIRDFAKDQVDEDAMRNAIEKCRDIAGGDLTVKKETA
jgi:hypothetical protein